jgi:hypothetical protein
MLVSQGLHHAHRSWLTLFLAGKTIPFEGVYINYKRSGLSSDMFQTLAPGESVTASVNAARTHKLAGIQTAQISALQGFKYVTGATAPDSIKDTAFCEAVSSNTVTITPDQSKAAGYVPLCTHPK